MTTEAGFWHLHACVYKPTDIRVSAQTWTYTHACPRTNELGTWFCVFSCPVDVICQLLGEEERGGLRTLQCCVLVFEGNCAFSRDCVMHQRSLTPCLTSEITSFHSASSSYWFWTTLGGLGLLRAPTQSLRPTKPHFVSIAHTTLGPKEGTLLGLTFSKAEVRIKVRDPPGTCFPLLFAELIQLLFFPVFFLWNSLFH